MISLIRKRFRSKSIENITYCFYFLFLASKMSWGGYPNCNQILHTILTRYLCYNCREEPCPKPRRKQAEHTGGRGALRRVPLQAALPLPHPPLLEEGQAADQGRPIQQRRLHRAVIILNNPTGEQLLQQASTNDNVPSDSNVMG